MTKEEREWATAPLADLLRWLYLDCEPEPTKKDRRTSEYVVREVFRRAGAGVEATVADVEWATDTERGGLLTMRAET